MPMITLENLEFEKDMHELFEYICNGEQFLFSTRLGFNSEGEFSEWIKNRINSEFHDFFMIKKAEKNIGYVHNYDFNLNDGHCKITVFVEQSYRKLGLGGIATIMFMDYLFKQYPFNKIYIDIYEYNEESLMSNMKAGFEEEGILKEYRYYSGKYYDMHILSMGKEKFNKTLRELVH